jgi:hypothetical protein
MRPRTEIVFDTATLDAALAEIRDALEGDSNDAEHDALVAVAELFGMQITTFDEREAGS